MKGSAPRNVIGWGKFCGLMTTDPWWLEWYKKKVGNGSSRGEIIVFEVGGIHHWKFLESIVGNNLEFVRSDSQKHS